MAIEFRNANWMADERDQSRTLSFLSENKLTYVCVDEPQGFKTSVPPLLAVTAPVSLLRMHGHNAEAWVKKGIGPAERFEYLYSEAELRQWLPGIHELSGEAREVHLLFNNCHRDYAVRNAHQMIDLLAAPGAGADARR